LHRSGLRDTVTPPPIALPRGDLRRIVLHWTAGDHVTAYGAYHVCVALDADAQPVALATHDLRANMCDVREGRSPYAAHTSDRNSYAIGLAVCGMAGATPHDFGLFPLRDDMIAATCATAARLAAFYEIALDAEHIFTHAEAALTDGYFGTGDDERWDIARLAPSPQALCADEARRAGDALRAMIGACLHGS
jgi:hypothetical protein